MPVERIDEKSRNSFLEGFSAQHRGWLITVETISANGELEVVIDDSPLESVRADGDAIEIVAGTSTHRVGDVTDLLVDRVQGDAIESVRIVAPSGETILSFRTVIPPELVDGIA
jgi:hypothetical protein